MKTSSAKAKGRRCSSYLKEKLLDYSEGLQTEDIVVTSSGDTGEDLKLSPLARSKFPFSFECKNVEKLNIWNALKQARSHTSKHIPALVFTRNREQTYIALDLDDFLKLFSKLPLDASEPRGDIL